MKLTSRYILLVALLAVPCFAPAQLIPDLSECPPDLPFEHYLAHAITGGAASFAFIRLVKAGAKVGEIIFDSTLVPACADAVGIFKTEYQANARAIISAIPAAAALVAGFYIHYKMPQWTDTHLLKYPIQRTQLQNCIAFLSRMIVPYPLGVCVGEFLAHMK